MEIERSSQEDMLVEHLMGLSWKGKKSLGLSHEYVQGKDKWLLRLEAGGGGNWLIQLYLEFGC